MIFYHLFCKILFVIYQIMQNYILLGFYLKNKKKINFCEHKKCMILYKIIQKSSNFFMHLIKKPQMKCAKVPIKNNELFNYSCYFL